MSSENLKPDIQEALGYRFKDPALLARAVTHSSYSGEKKKQAADNERLECLGDSVLQLVLTEHLYRKGLSEVQISRIRAVRVRGTELARAASEKLSLGDYIKLGKGEEETGGRKKPSILAGALEAVIGAIYLDGGYDAAWEFVLALLGPGTEEAIQSGGLADPKTILQEFCQKTHGLLPRYKLLEEGGVEHEKYFVSGVYIENRLCGKGRGLTKKGSEAIAAKEALKKLKESEK